MSSELASPARGGTTKVGRWAVLLARIDDVLTLLCLAGHRDHATRSACRDLVAPGGRKPSLERVAAALDVSPRTMQRRLAADGTSLTREIEEVRKTMAKSTLADRSISIEDVAFLLGYAKPSAFHRWLNDGRDQAA